MINWLILILLVIGVVWLIRKKPREDIKQPLLTTAGQHFDSAATQTMEDEEELITVITAAIAEFTGSSTDEFKVLKIQQHNNKWAFTGRQDVMHIRL